MAIECGMLNCRDRCHAHPHDKQKSAILVELGDSRVRAVAIGDEDVAVAVKRHVARPDELIAGPSGPRLRSPAGARRRRPRRAVPMVTASGFRPRIICTRPSGLNLTTWFDASSTIQILSCGIHAHRVRDKKCVEPLPDLPARTTPIAIELKEPGPSVRKQSRIAQPDGRVAGPRIDEQLPA